MRFPASKLRSLVGKLHARLSKLPSTRTKEQFEKNLKLGKKFIVLSLLNFIQNRFGVVAKKFRHGGLNCISRQRLIIPRKNKSLEKNRTFTIFGKSSVKFTEFGENFMHGCQSCILHVQRNNSRKNSWWGKKLFVFITFEFQSKYVRSFCEKVGHRSQKWIVDSTDDHSEKEKQISRVKDFFLYFFENSSVKFTEFGGNFMHGCQNCTQHVRRNNSRKIWSWGKSLLFYHFWILIKICSEFLRKSTVRWSKLHSTSTDDLAEKEEQISWKTHNFLHLFENSSVKFTEIGENFMHGCKNCILHVRSNNSRKFLSWGKKFTVFITFEF